MASESGGWQVRLGAICWIATVQYFVVQAVAQAAWTAPYSLVHNYISDLGNTACGRLQFGSYSQYVCSPWHGLANSSFIALGLLTVAGGVLTRRIWPRQNVAVWGGLFFLFAAGVGKVLVGLAPENVNGTLHNLGAASIPAGDVALLMLGVAEWRTWRWAACCALALGAVGLAAFLLYTNDLNLTTSVGLWERIADYPFTVWMIGRGAALLNRWPRRSFLRSPASLDPR